MDEAKSPSRMRSSVSPSMDADEFINPLHGQDLVRNRLGNEPRVKDAGKSYDEINLLSLSERQREKAVEEEENKFLDKMYCQKVEEFEKITQTAPGLDQAVLHGGAAANAVTDYQGKVHEMNEEKKALDGELAGAKVTANRQAVVVANKVMPVRQSLEERQRLLGETQQLRDKLAIAECAMKYERQLKEEYQLQLKLIEGTLMGASNCNKRLRQEDGWSSSHGPSPSQPTGGSDSAPGWLYEMLQEEVIALRKADRAKRRNLKEKEDIIEMLKKKVETLEEAIEIVPKKARREPSIMEEAMCVEKEPEHRANQFGNSEGSSSPLLPGRGGQGYPCYRVPSFLGVGEQYLFTDRSLEELERSGLEFVIPASYPEFPE